MTSHPPPSLAGKARLGKHLNRTLAGLTFGVLLVTGAVLFYCRKSFSFSCANEIIVTDPAPGGQWKAVVFQRDCGATTGFSTQISILRADFNLPDEPGNVFPADCAHDKAPAAPHGGPEVVLLWLDAGHLQIRHHPKARVFLAEPSMEAIAITYVPDLMKSTP